MEMKQFLEAELLTKVEDREDYFWDYLENKNPDALTDAWLENMTSYIYKVAVMTAIDSNKCDFAHIAIGVQRKDNSQPELKGYFYFSEGENDDMGEVINRAFSLIKQIHPVFDI